MIDQYALMKERLTTYWPSYHSSVHGVYESSDRHWLKVTHNQSDKRTGCSPAQRSSHITLHAQSKAAPTESAIPKFSLGFKAHLAYSAR